MYGLNNKQLTIKDQPITKSQGVFLNRKQCTLLIDSQNSKHLQTLAQICSRYLRGKFMNAYERRYSTVVPQITIR